MMAPMVPLSLIDASEHATGKTLTELNSMVRLAHALTEDKLENRTVKKPMFVTFVLLLGQIDEI